MKNLKKSFIAFIAAFAISCGDPDLPVELFPTMEYGAYARKMSQTGEYNYYEVATSSVDLSVELTLLHMLLKSNILITRQKVQRVLLGNH